MKSLVQNNAVSVATEFVAIGVDREELNTMERLTERKRNFDGTGVAVKGLAYGLLTSFASEILTKLADYEDLEEQGLLLKLPCKVGDSVFIILGKNISKQRIKEIKISDIEIEMTTSRRTFNVGSFGDNIFLTREEAEKKLKEMERNG